MKLFITKALAFSLGSLSCYCLQRYFQFQSITAAATVGFLGSYLHFPKYYEKKGLHSALYAGAFLAMTSMSILTGPLDVFIISLIGTGLYLLSKPFANGIGGKLGTIAFLSSIIFFMARGLW